MLKITELVPELIEGEVVTEYNRTLRSEVIKSINLLYNKNRGWIKFTLPPVKTFGGVKVKEVNKDIIYSINIKFDINNDEHKSAMNHWVKIFKRTCEILYNLYAPAKDKSESVNNLIKGPEDWYRDPTYLTYRLLSPNPEMISKYGYSMYLKLANYEKVKTKFFLPNGKEAEWNKLIKTQFTLLPILAIMGITMINKNPHLIVRLYNAIIISKIEPITEFKQELLSQYNVKISDDQTKEIEDNYQKMDIIKDSTNEENTEVDTDDMAGTNMENGEINDNVLVNKRYNINSQKNNIKTLLAKK